MRSLAISLTVTLLATSCATAPTQQSSAIWPSGSQSIDYTYAIQNQNGTPIDTAAYNQMIAAQGFGYYCKSSRCDTLPKLISGYTPDYPPTLQAAGITGNATIVFTIDELGFIVDPRVESATRPEFSEAAIRAIQTWKFKPASLSGKPVRLSSRQQFPFDLR